jgi:hypothetical protein
MRYFDLDYIAYALTILVAKNGPLTPPVGADSINLQHIRTLGSFISTGNQGAHPANAIELLFFSRLLISLMRKPRGNRSL